MATKYFFHLHPLTLKSKPVAGLKNNCKPVVGFNNKKCQPFSGRGRMKKSKKYAQLFVVSVLIMPFGFAESPTTFEEILLK